MFSWGVHIEARLPSRPGDVFVRPHSDGSTVQIRQYCEMKFGFVQLL